MRPREFRQTRESQNQLVLDKANLQIKRFFNLDTAAYSDGTLDAATKEMLGLACSMVLRCDDCIRYHLDQCHSLGVSDAAIQEVMNIALVVGGSIVIPHLRRAFEYWDELQRED